ncbi:MAG: Stp1/IreP family PP2C-type Ser/Thr phosphatase [Candidatus Latescibacteria bacterium]|nr:Stp1/IreP family PP2C-type Ser/Thr phosphatase [Candidatus Latescibacterota bacterium]
MNIKVIGQTNTGLVRGHNEDSFWFDSELGVAIVSDGMGGHAAGEVASLIAVESFKKVITARFTRSETIEDVKTLLSNSIGLANQEVLISMKNESSQQGMGATAVCACYWDKLYIIANIGDSRAYYIDKDKISQITKDDSLVQKYVDDGIINEEQARVHPQKNVITRHIGGHKDATPEIYTVEAVPNSKLLLCSDGLNSVMTDNEIFTIVNNAVDSETACEILISKTLEYGAPDNVTVVIFEIR